MTKKTLTIVIIAALVLALGVGIGVGFLLGRTGQGSGETQQTAPAMQEYTVEIKNTNGTGLAGIGVYIYTDDTLAELVWFAKTDDAGKMTFTDKVSDTYVAVLKDVPTGYAAEEYYAITGQVTEIILQAGELTEEDMQNIKYKLGDLMLDFTVVDTDGVEHTLSELLKTKKAVVLNFFYNECAPCKMEFPFLQEAYEQYKDQIALIAMNPVNTDEAAIAAFKQELGLTFPVAMVDGAWEKMMQLTAYPTTVVIDRFGNISLIHKGSVPDTKTFTDTFAYFTSEDYQPGVITDIAELLTEEEVGTATNPLVFGGVTSFEVTVEPGKTVYVDLLKVKDRYLQVKNADCSIRYDEKTYTPSSGTVAFMVSAPDNFTPAKLEFTNTGTETQTFKVTLSALKGSRDNPYALELGDFTVKTAAGNDQGVYYRYTATEEGVLVVRCTSSTVEKYGYSLYNLNSYAMRNLESDSESDEVGKFVSMPVKKGQVVEFSAGAMPDSSNSYPAATFTFNAVFNAGTLEEDKEKEKKNYTVTVTDDKDQPIAAVTVWFTQKLTQEDLDAGKKPETFSAATDETGKATLELEVGEYTVKLTTPADYIPDTNEYPLTAEQTELTVVFKPIVKNDYTVKFVNVYDEPVAGVVLSIGETTVTSDENGIATVKLEPGEYPVMIFSVPEGFLMGELFHQFPVDSTELTITVEYIPGTVNNPYNVQENPFTTVSIPAGTSVYYNVYGANGMILSLADEDAYIIYNGATHGKNENGVVTFPIAAGMPMMPTQLEIGNNGTAAKTFTVSFTYPKGSRENPEVLTDIATITTSLPAFDEDGYFYQWTATEDADVSFRLDSVTEGVTADLNVILGDVTKNISEDGVDGVVTVTVKAGDVLLIQPVSLEDADGNWYPAADIVVKSHIAVDAGTTDPSDPSEPESSEPESSETEPSTTETEPESSETTEPDDGMTDYSVTVQTADGTAVTGVAVQIRKGSALATGGMVDAEGKFTANLADGTYTVTVVDPTGTYSASKTGNELTVEKPELVVVVAKALADTTTVVTVCDVPVLPVGLGGTYVKLDASQANYFVDSGKGYCFFRVDISEPGIYEFTTTNGAVITNWGSNPQYIGNFTTTEEYANGMFRVQYKSSNFSEEGSVIGHLFAVEVSADVTDTVLLVQRLGDAEYTVIDAPWTTYSSDKTPVCVMMNGKLSPVNGNFKLTVPTGKSLVYLDMANLGEDFKVTLGSDGYYHLGDETGPVLYVNLKYTSYINFDLMINGDGAAGGTSLRCIFYDEEGNPIITGTDEDGYPTYKKEDYTEAMQKYIASVHKTHNVYGLTEELAYIIQNGGAYMGWYDSDHPNYIFDTDTVPEEFGWLFAACYIA